MRVVEVSSGSQSVSAGHTVGAVTVPGRYSYAIDLNALANGDTVQAHVLGKVLTGSTARKLTPTYTFANVQDVPNVELGPFDAPWDLELVLTKVGGTTRTVDWSLREHQSDDVLRKNLATAGAAGSITLDANAGAQDGLYRGCIVSIVGGTGVGQNRMITGYTGSTQVATVSPNWQTNPASGSVFVISGGPADLELWRQIQPNTLIANRPDVNVQAIASGVVDSIWAKTMAELAAVPPVNDSALAALEFLFLLARNKSIVTVSQHRLRNDADAADIATAALSNDGVTFVRGEMT